MAPAFRLVTGFLLAPWVPVLAYYALFSWIRASAGQAPSGSVFFVGMVPVVYLATIFLWLPFVFVLRRSNRERFVILVPGGMLLGVILGAAGLLAGGAPIFDPGSANFLMLAAGLGLLYAAAFWLIAIFRPAGPGE